MACVSQGSACTSKRNLIAIEHSTHSPAVACFAVTLVSAIFCCCYRCAVREKVSKQENNAARQRASPNRSFLRTNLFGDPPNTKAVGGWEVVGGE